MKTLSEALESLIKKYGPLYKSVRLEKKAIADIQQYMPMEFVQFIERHGIGMWLEGKFQFCQCDIYADVCKFILSGDPQYEPGDSAIFGFTAFGKVFIWNQKHKQVISVQLPRLIATADSVDRKSPELGISDSLTFIDHDYTDMFEDTPTAPRLFGRTLKKLGSLDLGEIYGFVPALATGGSARLATIKKMKALEHLLFLAQLGRAKLMDYSDGRERFVRMLGS